MKKIKPEQIYEYYSSDKFEPIMPRHTNFRHFRFKLSDKSWRKVPEKISTKEELIKWIIKLGGCDIYYSITEWFNPHIVSAKGMSGTYFVADNLILNNDLVFDIDATEPVTLNRLDIARKSTYNIYEIMRRYVRQYELEYLAFTGLKGFRLVYKDRNIELPTNARERLDYIETKRNLFIDEIHEKLNRGKFGFYKVKSKFDEKVTTNVMGVIRVLGTVHSSTGYISTKLSPTSLKKPIDKLLYNIPHIGKRRPVIPKREMKLDGGKPPCPRLLQSAKDVTGLASLPYQHVNFRYFFTNRVLGVKRGYIPILIYQKFQTRFKKEVTQLQEKYRLGLIYIYDADNYIVVLALKVMQKRQLQKLLNESTSKTKYDFMKYNRIFSPLLMKQTEKVYNKFTGRLSKGHFYYVEPHRIPNEDIYCGWPQIELIKAIKDG